MPTLFIPKIKTHYGEKTFKYFFNKFLEKTCIVYKLKFLLQIFENILFQLLILFVLNLLKYLKTLISVIRNSVIYIMEKGKTDSHLLIYYQVVNLKIFYF